ncbi:unnamed protein product, partial [Sphacelaria rigidula]
AVQGGNVLNPRIRALVIRPHSCVPCVLRNVCTGRCLEIFCHNLVLVDINVLPRICFVFCHGESFSKKVNFWFIREHSTTGTRTILEIRSWGPSLSLSISVYLSVSVPLCLSASSSIPRARGITLG